jgi:ankyrin repeat protein
MNNIRLLFDLIKKHKWDDVITKIKENEDIDINIRDDTGNYLINYAILFNKIEVVSILIYNGAKLDITDNDGRSILYIPIKYGFSKILNLLLHFNKTNIGISLIDIQDKNINVPVHYAIFTNNMTSLKMLIDNDANLDALNSQNMNSLQLAIMNRNEEMVKLICDNGVNINNKSDTGENALHMACNLQLYSTIELLISKHININVQDYEYEFTSLDYSIINNDLKTVSILLKNGAFVNIQDIFGNSPLYYCVKEDNYEILNLLINSEYTKNIINYNLYNIDSKLPIHVLLSKDTNKIMQYLEQFIDNSDINFQDNFKISPLHYITKLGIWKIPKLQNILRKKKMNIFISNNDGMRPIDNVDKEDLIEFINLVTDSYLYILRNNNFTWKLDWENACNKELFLNKMSTNELKIIKDIYLLKNVELPKNDNIDTCRAVITNKLLTIYKNENSGCNFSSFPSKLRKKCLLVTEGSKLETCTFTGASLDVLFGLIHLLQKHRNACSPIDKNFDNNNELCKYYRSIGFSEESKCEFINFEIVWVLQKIYFSSSFKQNFNQCIENDTTTIIIPLGIELEKGSHANYLIYTKKTKELERFEPYGSAPPHQFDYNPKLLDNILKYYFKNIDADIIYIDPSYMPKIGFQYFDTLENTTGKIGDPGGFCALWSIWYADQRMMYPDINREELVKKLIKGIKIQNISFKDIIRNYSKNIIVIRDTVLNQNNLTINDWINDQYTHDQFNMILSDIKNIILSL